MLKKNKNLVITKTPIKSVLTIKKVGKNDHGKYICQASNGFGPPVEASGSLVVEDRRKLSVLQLGVD